MKRRNEIQEAIAWAFAKHPIPKYPVFRGTPEQIHYLACSAAREAAIAAFRAGWRARRTPPQSEQHK